MEAGTKGGSSLAGRQRPRRGVRSEDFLTVYDLNPLLERLEEASSAVYHWNDRGLPLGEEEEEEEEVTSRQPEDEKPPARKPWPHNPIHPADMFNDEEYREIFRRDRP